MASSGYLFIADITGYTSYLTSTELEHARSTLEDLLGLLVREIRPPMQVSKLEGDAVLAFSEAGAFHGGQTLVELVETIYLTFRKALELMVVNTTCTCQACSRLDQLDLKFCVHHGSYATQKIGSFVELVGTEVTLLHRLMKNHVAERLGNGAYALYTDAAVDAAGIRPLAEDGMLAHTETYEHLGETSCWIQPMHEVWERRRDSLRVHVPFDEAILRSEVFLPVPPPVAWEYLTLPETRALIAEDDRNTLKDDDARIGAGTTYVCAHGGEDIEHHVVDWRPFEDYTFCMHPVMGVPVFATWSLEAEDGGTRARLGHRIQGGALTRWLGQAMASVIVRPIQDRGIEALRLRVLRDLDEGVVTRPRPASPAAELDVQSAVRFRLDALAEPEPDA